MTTRTYATWGAPKNTVFKAADDAWRVKAADYAWRLAGACASVFLVMAGARCNLGLVRWGSDASGEAVEVVHVKRKALGLGK